MATRSRAPPGRRRFVLAVGRINEATGLWVRAKVVRWAHRPDAPILFGEKFLDALGDRGERQFGGRTPERRTDVAPVAAILIGDVGDDVVPVALRSLIDHEDPKAGRVIQRPSRSACTISSAVRKRTSSASTSRPGASSTHPVCCTAVAAQLRASAPGRATAASPDCSTRQADVVSLT